MKNIRYRNKTCLFGSNESLFFISLHKTNTYCMNKKDILKCLIEENVFASSPSAFARMIGYRGSATVQRLLKNDKGRNDERAVDSIWEKMKNAMAMDNEEVVMAFRVTRCADFLFGQLKSTQSEWIGEGWQEKSLVALLKGNFCAFTDEFRKENEFDIQNARSENSYFYYKVIVAVFLKMKNFDLYRRGRFSEGLTTLIDDIDSMLRDKFDDNNTEGHKMAERLKAEQQLKHANKNKYGAICYLTSLVMQYAAPNKWLHLITNITNVYDWGWLSYWIKPNSSPNKGEEFWGLLEAVKDGSNGFYNLYHCYICNDSGDADCDGVYRVMFEENENACHMTICTLPEMYIPVKQEIRSYAICMDKERRRIDLRINDDNHFGLPSSMKMYDYSVIHEEKGWKKIIEHYGETNEERSQRKQVARAAGIEILDFEDGEYKIEDVFVGREDLVIMLYEKRDNSIHYYEIKRDSRELLDNITPDDDILICRHFGDDRVYVEWTTPSFFVALEEFKEVRHLMFSITN